MSKPKKKSVGRPSGDDPTARFNLTIPKKLHITASKKAATQGKTFSSVVSELLREWVSK